MRPVISIALVVFTCVFVLPASAQQGGDAPSEEALSAVGADKTYSPYASRTNPKHPLWGDTHVHTNLSMDAGLASNRLPPETAYRFARGEEVDSSFGHRVRLSRPLDWLVIADHSDGMGMVQDLLAGDPALLAFDQAAEWSAGMLAGGQAAVEAKMDLVTTFSAGGVEPDLIGMYAPGSKRFRNIWEKAIATAEAYNEPGKFTALIGYEWTSLVDGNNQHRVVILRDDAERARQVVPMTMTPPEGSPDPIDLWKWIATYESKTSGEALAIAHNGNISNGTMFPLQRRWNNKRVNKDYVAQRARYEPLYEITQIKGDGEAHPFLSPDDEFADFETWDIGNLAGTAAKTDDMLAGEYAREALKRGLALEERLDTNPYKLGLIGSTDSHTSLATAEEENFFGKNSVDEPHDERMTYTLKTIGDRSLTSWQSAAAGLAAVWATENSREAIFDAMLRKEVYGTTGPRITLRMFGGWNFGSQDLESRTPAVVGYEKGIPMGGDLRAKPADANAPTFMVYALRDPIGANLDRIQVVKGWLDSEGQTHEKVYDIAWSGERKPGADGQLPPVGNTVDAANATWTNSIGAAELGVVWTDPDFDPAQRAFYYTRVLEIPTPRWTTYDAVHFGIDIPEGAPVALQERAYSSPIWYAPE